jgi:RNA polymerase sigma factor (sigma-70 family)
LHQEGASIRQIVVETQLPRPAVYRAILDERLGRLTRRRAQFIDDPLFHQDDAEAVIDALLAQQELADIPAKEDLRTPRDLPDFLRELYRTPLLSKGRERALFLKLNCLKHQYTQARRRLEPELVRGRDLRGIEVLLTRIADARNAILQANLRLVVSVARRHLRPGVVLNELISDGSMTLMRAIDGFDISRGHRFSTYATLALMKGFARSVPAMLAANRRCEGDPQTLEAIADARQPSAVGRLAQSEQVAQLLGRLSDRERIIVAAHFGLDDADNPSSYDQVGERLGLSRERVRQIEQLALAKLRAALQPEI